MNEVIASILDAEKKAEDIVKSATEKSKKIRGTADIDGEKIKNSAIAVFKVHRASMLNDAEKRANDVYAEVIKEGKTQAEKLVKTVSAKVEAVSDDVIKGIIG